MNREEFFLKLRPSLAPSSIKDIELAYTLAKYSHRAQTRKELGPDGEPLRYFEHVRRVALILIDEVKYLDPDTIIAALLHDGIEDTRDLTPDMIEHTFGTQAARVVMLLSKNPKEGYLERLLNSRSFRAFVIKGCDRLDNLRTLPPDPAFRQKQITETREKFYPLFDRMVELAPVDRLPGAQWLRQAIIAETERQAGILEGERRAGASL